MEFIAINLSYLDPTAVLTDLTGLGQVSNSPLYFSLCPACDNVGTLFCTWRIGTVLPTIPRGECETHTISRIETRLCRQLVKPIWWRGTGAGSGTRAFSRRAGLYVHV